MFVAFLLIRYIFAAVLWKLRVFPAYINNEKNTGSGI